MAKPTDNMDDKMAGEKKGPQIDQTVLMILNNVVLIVILIISMFVMYTSLESSFDKKISKLLPESAQSDSEEGDESENAEGVLLDLGEFILNLADPKRYLKVAVAMELSKTAEETNAKQEAPKASGHGEAPAAFDPNAAITAEMERYKPAIRDAVISILSSKTSDELSSVTGKELAKEEILEAVNNIFEGHREVLRVSFGQFIIQ